MNIQPRVDLLEVIGELSRRYPDWRFGQLIANVAGWADRDVWDVEDEQLLRAAQLHLQQANSPSTPYATTPAQADRRSAPSN
jgi:hypothetical protein